VVRPERWAGLLGGKAGQVVQQAVRPLGISSPPPRNFAGMRGDFAMTTKESTACPKCYGTGQLPIAQHVDPTHTRKLAPILCPRCGGTGRKESERP